MNSLVKGSLLIAAGTVYKIFLTLLTDKYLATNLGAEDFGQFKYGITIVLLLSTFCTLGFPSSIVRSVAIQNSHKKKRMLITISLMLVTGMSIIIILLGSIFPSLFGIDSAFLFATIFFSLNTLYSAVYSGLEKPGLKVWINDLFGFTAYLIFLWLFFNFYDNSKNIAFVYLCYGIVVFACNVVFSMKYVSGFNKDYFNSIDFKEYIKYSKPLFGVSLVIMFSTHLDKLVLNLFVSEAQLGIYYAVFAISNLLPLILTILVFMYLPRMSRFLENRKKRRATLISSYFSKWTMIAASMFFWTITFYAEDLIVMLYSHEFTSGILVLKILALGQWLNVSLGFTGQNLLALGDSKRQLYIRVSSFLLGGLLLFYGAKVYGSIGVAVAGVIALILSNTLQIAVLRLKHGFFGYRKQNIFCLGIILVTGFFLAFLHSLKLFEHFNFLLLICADVLIFMVILLLTKTIGKKDIKALRITSTQ